MLGNVVHEIHKVLSMIKDFIPCTSSKSGNKGYMMFSYKDKQYALKIVEVDEDCQKYDLVTNIKTVESYFNNTSVINDIKETKDDKLYDDYIAQIREIEVNKAINKFADKVGTELSVYLSPYCDCDASSKIPEIIKSHKEKILSEYVFKPDNPSCQKCKFWTMTDLSKRPCFLCFDFDEFEPKDGKNV